MTGGCWSRWGCPMCSASRWRSIGVAARSRAGRGDRRLDDPRAAIAAWLSPRPRRAARAPTSASGARARPPMTTRTTGAGRLKLALLGCDRSRPLRARAPSATMTISDRRTFAIISHPDAGKTTLTEKLLLFRRRDPSRRRGQGARAEPARAVGLDEDRAAARHLGHLSVMTFERDGITFNLLDTPGHEDFSEDTYRTLTAVDSAVMVIDAARGIEAQTRKLFEVCRLRSVPIITFVNKVDREGAQRVRTARRDRRHARARRLPDELAGRDGRAVSRACSTSPTNTISRPEGDSRDVPGQGRGRPRHCPARSPTRSSWRRAAMRRSMPRPIATAT